MKYKDDLILENLYSTVKPNSDDDLDSIEDIALAWYNAPIDSYERQELRTILTNWIVREYGPDTHEAEEAEEYAKDIMINGSKDENNHPEERPETDTRF